MITAAAVILCQHGNYKGPTMTDLTIIIGNKKYSSWSLRGWLAVKLSGLAFDEIKLPLDTPEYYSEIKKYSPIHSVPVLKHGDITVWDSMAIIDYIDRICPGANLWPKDDAAFAHAKAISAEMHSGFTGIRRYCPMNMGKVFSGLAMGERVAKDVARIDALWAECRANYGASGDFLFGDFSAADIIYAPVASRFETYELPRSQVSDAYIKAVLDHPAMQVWAADAMSETLVISADEIDPDAKVLG